MVILNFSVNLLNGFKNGVKSKNRDFRSVQLLYTSNSNFKLASF